MSHRSASKPQLARTNLPVDEMIMDTRGVKDARFYCLPPYRGDPNRLSKPRRTGGGYPFHLVSQGHVVGIFDNWVEAQASLDGYPGSGNRGFHSEDECVDAWQGLCVRGVHPHPVDLAFLRPPSPGASTFVNTSPRKSRSTPPSPVKPSGTSAATASKKREGTPVRSPQADAQLLADLKRYASPILPAPPSPQKASRAEMDDGEFVNFAIRGGGIISSSPIRSEQRYREMQRRGEEPDMLVTRSFAQASLFALSEGGEAPVPVRTAARKRARAGLPPVKPGKVGWVHGTKLGFFKAYKDEYLAAAEINEGGSFYSRVAHLYLAKYGYNMPWDGDLEEGQDVADDVDPDEDVDGLPAEEGEARAEYFSKLRNKIGVWYNGQYGSVVNKRTKKVTFKTVFDKTALEPPRPAKLRVLHYFSRKFYDELIKNEVTTRYAALSRLPNPPAVITVRNAVTKQVWHAQTEAFRSEVLAAREAEHKAALEAYSVAVSGEVPTTAEEYNINLRALNNAGYYLQPFADAAHERFGMNVVIMMCGPVPERGGRIEVRSIHSGKSNGLAPRIWADFDRAGFDKAQRSFIEFSHNCFTEDECRARSLNSMVGGVEEEGEGSIASLGGGSVDHVRDSPPAGSGAVPPSTQEGPTRSLVDWNPMLPKFDALLGPEFQPPPAQAHGRHDMQLLADPNAPLPDPNAGQPDPNAPLLPLGGFNMALPLWTMPPNFGDFGLPQNPLEDWMAPGLAGADWMARTPSLITPGPGVGVALRDPSAPAEGGDTGLDEGEGPLAITPHDEGPANPHKEREEEPRDDDEEEEGDQREEHVASSKESGSKRARAPAPRRRAAGATPAAPAAKKTRPKPKPAWRGLRVAAATATTPEEETDGVAGAEEDGGEDNGAGDKEDGGEDKQEGVWKEDTSEWSQELRNALSAFARGKSWGGKEWEECVTGLIALERAWEFPAKGQLAAPNSAGDRPQEIPDFMQAGRKWASPVELQSICGPSSLEESFARQWWKWWDTAQPGVRRNADGKLENPQQVPASGWEDIGKMAGRNGLLLFVGGLFWWGEAASAAEDSDLLLDDWRKAVEDVAGVMREAVKELRPVLKKPQPNARATAKAPTTRSSKRKTPDTRTARNKENKLPARKRARKSV
ncbi:hypothetical protein B0H13DRAFT_1904987 [Mycena leptocephala]|nr:hypothetical protein B0H13DRAFT_1904987 [Mycena leptocephala]